MCTDKEVSSPDGTPTHLALPQGSQTQLTEVPTQPFTQNEDSFLYPPPDETSPFPKQPRWWGKLIPCTSSESHATEAILLRPKTDGNGPLLEDEYTIGRSIKCDIQVDRIERDVESDHQKKRAEWAYCLISNRHCSIKCSSVDGYTLTDSSGNGTKLNETILRKGDVQKLNSGDTICLLNPKQVSKKILRTELQTVLQEYSFVFVPNILHIEKKPSDKKPTPAVRIRSLARSVDRAPRLYPPTAPTQRLLISDDYDLGDIIGTGTVGEVRKAVNKRTGEAVAVKILGRSQLAAEVKILRQLAHPYIVRLIDVYYETHTAYLVMELMETDLFSCIVKKERFSEMEARFLMR